MLPSASGPADADFSHHRRSIVSGRAARERSLSWQTARASLTESTIARGQFSFQVLHMTEAARLQWLIDGLRRGDQQVALVFCKEYAEPLERVADRKLVGGLRRRVGAEDVVQSVCRTFLRRMSAGEFELTDSESLWRLLCAITLSKISKQARWHQRHKRNVDQEVCLDALEHSGNGKAYELEAPGPTPDEAAEFADQFRELVAALGEEEGRIIDLKLQQHTNEETAAMIGCSERTVRRLLKRVRERLQGAFLD